VQDEGLNLLFKGDIAPGCELPQVQAHLATLLKVDSDRVRSLFDGRTMVIKKNLSRSEAEKYKRMFDSTGAVSIIEVPIAPSPPTPATPLPHLTPSPSDSGSGQPAFGVIPPVSPLQGPKHESPSSSTRPLVDHSNTTIPGSRSYAFFMCLISLLGITLLSFGLYNLVDTVKFSNASVSGLGTITGYSVSKSSGTRSSKTFAPEVSFRAPSGRLIRFRSQLSTSIISKKVGDRIAVKYDPAEPHHAEIDGFLPMWGPSLILLLLGAAFTWGGRKMVIFQLRAKRPIFGASHLETIVCPRCGFEQPQTKLCRVCRVDIPHYNELLTKAVGFPGNLTVKQRVGFALFVFVVVLVIGVGGFVARFQAFSSIGSGGIIPYTWSDSIHHYEITVPVDWQAQSTADVTAAYPILRSEPSPMYQLVITSKINPATVIASGYSGISAERLGTDGWEGIGAEGADKQKKVFSDVIKHNGLTLHRFGYETSLGYREDAYFEAGKDVIMVRFAVPSGAGNVAAEISRARSAVMTNLTGT
jgi:hypothetical protein